MTRKEPITLTVIRVPADPQKYQEAIRTLVRIARRNILRERAEHETEIKTKEKEG